MFPIMLYPETHFRFGRISPSLLFKREPEVLFDAPARCSMGCSLPLFLLLNDIDQYPATIESVEVAITQGKKHKHFRFESLKDFQTHHPTSEKTSAYEISLDVSSFKEGRIAIAPLVHLKLKQQNRISSILTDNLRTASHQPLTTFLSGEAYPGSDQCFYGDMHCHSIHSRSHVEFGAPIPWYRSTAKVSGISVVSIIDHTYDLEALPNDYLKRDKELQNWHLQQSQQRETQPLILLSQEHSARKAKGGVVHMGVLGYKKLLKGSGDGARKGYKKSLEPSLEEAAQEVCRAEGITFAAHPGEPTTLMQRIFLRRDNWRMRDFTNNITAFQALNRGLDSSWYRARKMWISLLLQRKRLPLLAGNDAHGDFNRYRAIAYPFITLKEDFYRYFGLARTGFYAPLSDETALLNTIREGKTFITTGPFVDIQESGISRIGHHPLSINTPLSIIIKSSKEFGAIKRVRLHIGTENREECLLLPFDEKDFCAQIPLNRINLKGALYLRFETETECGDNGLESFAATSPLYFT